MVLVYHRRRLDSRRMGWRCGNFNKVASLLLLRVVALLLLTFLLAYLLYNEVTQEAELKVILLDTYADVKGSNLSLYGEAEPPGRKDKNAAERSDWTITGLEYYHDIETTVRVYRVFGEDILARRDEHNTQGVWVLGRKIGDVDDTIANALTKVSDFGEEPPEVKESNPKEGFILLKNFQFQNPVEIAFGITYYLEGDAVIRVMLWGDKIGKKHHLTLELKTEKRFFNFGVCNEIIQVPRSLGKVTEIGFMVQLGNKNSFAAIDKVTIAMGKGDQSTNLIYSLLPGDWCSVGGPVGEV